VGKSVIDPRGARIVGVGKLDASRQRGGNDVTIPVQSAVLAVMGALGERLGYSLAAQAVLAECGGSGAGPVQPPTGGGAFVRQRGNEHAGTE
jgi:hypothetical protein